MSIQEPASLFCIIHPKNPPSSQYLLNELYKASPASAHSKIDELIKQIVIYDSKIDGVNCTQVSGTAYQVSLKASVQKHREDGYGKRAGIEAYKTNRDRDRV